MSKLPDISSKYASSVLKHFTNPSNVGSLNAKSSSVGTGLVGAPACGDVMKLQIEIKNNIIKDAKFRTFGCGSAIASSSLATEWIKGKTIEESLRISNREIANKLSLPPVKLHCSMLAEEAIKSAIKDYRNKNSDDKIKPDLCK